MKSVLLCFLVLSMVAGGFCRRLRRQAPSGVADGGADIDGIPEGITTQANTKADGLNLALTAVLNDMNRDKVLGLPVDQKKLDTVLTLSMVVGIVGGEVSDSNEEGIANLLAKSADDVTDAGPADA